MKTFTNTSDRAKHRRVHFDPVISHLFVCFVLSRIDFFSLFALETMSM